MRLHRDESGQVLVLTALCMTALMGFMALAIDVGMLFRAKRNLQIAADAAASAAALDYFYNKGSNTAVSAAQTVGTKAANDNGIAASNGATISIKAGGASSFATPWHDSTGFFEATLTKPSPMAFMALFGFNSVPVVARAVAGTPGGDKKDCIYILAPTGNLGASGVGGGNSSMYLKGSFNLNAPGCGIQVDATDLTDALHYNGNGGTTSAAFIAVVGGVGGNIPTPPAGARDGVAPVTDPMNAFTVPGPASTSTTNPDGTTTPYSCAAPPAAFFSGTAGSPYVVGSTASSITCYTYSGGITAKNLTLNGLVIFNGTGDVTWGAVKSGSGGTTIDITQGGMQESAGTSFNLTSSQSGPLPNVVLAAPTTNNSQFQVQFGNSTGTFNGIVYLPDATLYFQDSGADHSGGLNFNIDIVAGQLFDQTATLNINGAPPTTGPGPLDLVTLVE